MITKGAKTALLTAIFSMFCFLLWSSLDDTKSNSSERERNEIQTDAGKNTPCRNLSEFLKKEFQSVTKPLKDKPSKRLYGVQQKDAMTQALKVCAKLKAKQVNSDNDDMVYDLPDGFGKIIIRESSGEHIFLNLIFVTECVLPFTEIEFVSLKYYNGHGSK